eukprot:5222738-Pyramimonas_sp.AAC.1
MSPGGADPDHWMPLLFRSRSVATDRHSKSVAVDLEAHRSLPMPEVEAKSAATDLVGRDQKIWHPSGERKTR